MLSSEAKKLFADFRDSRTEITETTKIDLEAERQGAESAGNLTTEPQDVNYGEVFINDLRCLTIEPKEHLPSRKMIFVHGGAFALMSPESHRRFAAHVAVACRTICFVPDYSLAPEETFPKAVNEVSSLCKSLMEQYKDETIIFIGDSAGGGLVLSSLVKFKEDNHAFPEYNILLCPWLDLSLSGDSITQNKDNDVVLNEHSLRHFAKLYLDDEDAKHPLASPLFSDVSELANLYVQAGEYDLLLDDAVRLSRAVPEDKITLDIFPEMVHCFQFFAGILPEADAAIKKIAAYIDLKEANN